MEGERQCEVQVIMRKRKPKRRVTAQNSLHIITSDLYFVELYLETTRITSGVDGQIKRKIEEGKESHHLYYVQYVRLMLFPPISVSSTFRFCRGLTHDRFTLS